MLTQPSYDNLPDASPAATRHQSWLSNELADPDATTVTIGSGGIMVEQPDADEQDEREAAKPNYLRHNFDENLAEHLTGPELATLAHHIQMGIDADKSDRFDWEAAVAESITWLGIRVATESGADSSGSGADAGVLCQTWESLLLESCNRFWANAVGEFLPASGPAKVRDDAPPRTSAQPPPPPMGHNGGAPMQPEPQQVSRNEFAEAFEKDLNHYLTVADRSYYRDFSRMLWNLAREGTEFRKVYWNPLRGRPVSEWVKSSDLIVSSDATDLSTAARITQIIMTSQSDAKRLQRSGWWRECVLMQPFEQPSEVEQAEGDADGVRRRPTLPEDHRHTIEECYLELDLPGFEHTDEDDEQTGMPLAYRVALDKDSRQILEIRRNWRKDDPLFEARLRYIMFGLIPGLNFYYNGFAHILGNQQLLLTSLTRQLVDAGQFGNFPGFLAAKGMTRQLNTDIMVEPGQVKEIDTMGQPIGNVVMPLPYKGADQTLMALASSLRDNAFRLAGVADAPVGEGTADIPVGTMIAMIEQSTKVMSAVHKGLHASRAEELEMLRELIAEDPSVLNRFAKKTLARQWMEAKEFTDLDLVPSSDPNVPSQLHRIMQAWSLVQMAIQAPGILDPKWVIENAMRTINFELPPEAFAQQPNGPPPGPPPDPAKMALAQAMQQKTAILAQDTQRKAAADAVQGENARQEAALDMQDAAAERASKERIAQTEQETERVRLAAELAKQHVAQQHASVENALGRAHDHAKIIGSGIVSAATRPPAAPQSIRQQGIVPPQ